MLSSVSRSSGLLETRNLNPENGHWEQNHLLSCISPVDTQPWCRFIQLHLGLMIESLLFFFFFSLFIPSMPQTKEKIIIKFYKLAATKNKQESTIRNESHGLTESPLRTITLMQSRGLRRSQWKTLLGQFWGERRYSPPVIFTSCPNMSVDVQRKHNLRPLLWIKIWITRAIKTSSRTTDLTLCEPREATATKAPDESCLILIVAKPECHLSLGSTGIFPPFLNYTITFKLCTRAPNRCPLEVIGSDFILPLDRPSLLESLFIKSLSIQLSIHEK